MWLIVLGSSLSPIGLAATTPVTAAPTSSTAKPEAVSAEKPKPEYPQNLNGAKQAFKDTNYTESLKILARLEGDNAGNVEYDYLLGRCALETRNFDLAVSAFTRALTVDPGFAAARFELARTYYSKGVALLARGPFEQARAEFTIVSSMNPPADLISSIKQYQANIDKYLKVRETEFKLFVQMTGGYDTNLASTSDFYYFDYYDYGTASQQTYRLKEENRERESIFGQMQAGIGIAWPLFSNNFEIFGNLLTGGQSYSSQHDYDQSWDQIQFGARHYGENDKKTVRAQFRKIHLMEKDENYNEEGGVTLEWAIKMNKHNALTFTIMGGDSSYHDNQTHVYSVNYNRSSVEWTHLLEGTNKPSVQILLVGGRDNPQQCNNNTGPNNYCPGIYSRDVGGYRLAWSTNLTERSRFYSSLFYEKSDYDREFFYQQRVDRRLEVFLGLNTTFGSHWYIRPELHYINNESTINLYSYERGVASVTLGWGF